MSSDVNAGSLPFRSHWNGSILPFALKNPCPKAGYGLRPKAEKLSSLCYTSPAKGVPIRFRKLPASTNGSWVSSFTRPRMKLREAPAAAAGAIRLTPICGVTRSGRSRVLCVDTAPSLLRSGLCERAERIGTQLLWTCQLAQLLDPETCTTGHTYRH